ncbi:Helix-turn-helix domain-containing protein [Actinopolyspora xinjiangensis]|uniref:Helix-turn-helix domain-containing protein n=1 Tax=Actinopolyspora xinjiangensis TaxID=405564 RepID=A0A1H0W8H9_9ACTN|nr:helix-turn-helix transcriptional regulator [Actinopolyspora xinjiangensis]SDP87064.1 Helix-turn-helix domain-containing protein [Actinopolyspora xinjiangensis]
MARQEDRNSETGGVDELVTQLRRLRARSGLTLTALGERTNYSKSSWGRYLSGRTLPPYQAVLAFCRVVEADQERVLALWEAAHRERARRASHCSERSEEDADGDAVSESERVPVAGESSVGATGRDGRVRVPLGVVLGSALLGLGLGCLLGARVVRSHV